VEENGSLRNPARAGLPGETAQLRAPLSAVKQGSFVARNRPPIGSRMEHFGGRDYSLYRAQRFWQLCFFAVSTLAVLANRDREGAGGALTITRSLTVAVRQKVSRPG